MKLQRVGKWSKQTEKSKAIKYLEALSYIGSKMAKSMKPKISLFILTKAKNQKKQVILSKPSL
jgi:hypothetical protein